MPRTIAPLLWPRGDDLGVLGAVGRAEEVAGPPHGTLGIVRDSFADCVVEARVADDRKPIDLQQLLREAVANAVRHGGADRVDVGLSVANGEVQLSVADNGTGMDAAILKHGKDGHFGLPGMRERAARIGAKLTVVSAPAVGTEIALIVPGRTIFARQTSRPPTKNHG